MKEKILLLWLFFALTGVAGAAEQLFSKGMMIVGYDGTAWYPYIKQHNSNWVKIKEIINPASVTWQATSDSFYFKAEDRYLYSYSTQDKAVSPILQLETQEQMNNSYTQLRASRQALLMVELIDGKSQNTQIVSINKLKQRQVMIKQASAQFHPYFYDNNLYYAHVSCRVQCGALIQEVWRKDIVSGNAKQLSLLNAVTYLHSVDISGKYGYISSNQRGYYHIAQLNLDTHKVLWLSSGQVTDSFPSITADGDLFFVRRNGSGSKLMMLARKYLNKSAEITTSSYQQVALPKQVQKIRYLEIVN